MRYYDKYDYFITVMSGQFSSLFPNIVKDKNEIFYYLKYDTLKTLTLTEHAYEDKNINAIIQQNLSNKAIKLIVYQCSARCKLVLKQGYKIYFTYNENLVIYLDLIK